MCRVSRNGVVGGRSGTITRRTLGSAKKLRSTSLSELGHVGLGRLPRPFPRPSMDRHVRRWPPALAAVAVEPLAAPESAAGGGILACGVWVRRALREMRVRRALREAWEWRALREVWEWRALREVWMWRALREVWVCVGVCACWRRHGRAVGRIVARAVPPSRFYF